MNAINLSDRASTKPPLFRHFALERRCSGPKPTEPVYSHNSTVPIRILSDFTRLGNCLPFFAPRTRVLANFGVGEDEEKGREKTKTAALEGRIPAEERSFPSPSPASLTGATETNNRKHPPPSRGRSALGH
jgi:hypothetical protein